MIVTRWMRRLGAVAIAVAFAACGHTPPPPATAATPTATAPVASARGSDTASPRHDLSQDERTGGHTLARHVSRTDEQLRGRLRAEPGISAASTYTDRDTAERVVALALETQHARVEQWRARSGARPNLTLNVHSPDGPIGRSVSRRGLRVESCDDAIVVLRWRDGGFYVLTSYPEARR